ncbi:MAG: ABC transporter permease [Chloroflexi bacterium]|nr:ABC transporter permease [Chloroflexota bacterium]
MAKYLAFRVLYMVIVMIGVSIIVFAFSRMSGDPRYLYMTALSRSTPEQWEAKGKEMGLDRALPVQYLIWLGRAVRGNFGNSFYYQVNSLDMILEDGPATLKLSGISFLLAVGVGIPLGVLSAIKRGTLLDLLIRSFALVGQAAPPFWVGILLIYIFAVNLRWLPTSRMGDWTHYVLPATTLAWLAAAGLLRITRSAMLEVLDSEYVKLARAKGVGHTKVIWKHAFKNALVAPLTFAAVLFASFIIGTVIVETVFAWPGIGRLAVQAALNTDFPLITSLAVIFAAAFLLSSLAADLLYAAIDPRVRIG